MKTGLPLRERFNYNCETQKVEFIDEQNMILELSNAMNIDTLYLAGHKLIPYKNRMIDMYYRNEQFTMFIDYRCHRDNKGKIGAYGIRTHNGVQTLDKRDYDHIGGGGMIVSKADTPHVQLDNDQQDPNVYETSYYNNYVLEINGKKKVFNNKKSLLKAFPEKTDTINKYLDNNNVNFNHIEDILQMLKSIM